MWLGRGHYDNTQDKIETARTKMAELNDVCILFFNVTNLFPFFHFV
jgi:hypothetical protein